MTGEEATAAVIDALNAVAVPHMLVGSLASNFYGVPRSTQDADFVLELGSTPIAAFVNQLGPGFRLDPQLSSETATGTTRYLVQLVDLRFQIELLLLSDDAHDKERFARRRRVRILDQETYVLTAEDVIITKLRWALHGRRAKDLEDVRNVIAVQEQHLDWEYVNVWCDRHGTCTLLESVRRDVSPSS